MGAKAYTRQEIQEAVAMAALVGAEATARTLGMQERTVRSWCAKAGTAPADTITSSDWADLGEMARRRVMAALKAGTIRPKDAAVIGAIADRNVRQTPTPAITSAVAAREAFDEWLSDTAAEAMDESTTEADYQATIDGIDAVLPELIRRANAESGQPHRPAILAWFSGRTDQPAGDVLEWAQGQVRVVLAEHGTLAALAVWREAERIADHERMEAQLERNRQAAFEWTTRSLDPETAALLAEAEAWLAEHRT